MGEVSIRMDDGTTLECKDAFLHPHVSERSIGFSHDGMNRHKENVLFKGVKGEL